MGWHRNFPEEGAVCGSSGSKVRLRERERECPVSSSSGSPSCPMSSVQPNAPRTAAIQAHNMAKCWQAMRLGCPVAWPNMGELSCNAAACG